MNMLKNKTILVCYASTGSGHNVAAKAIYDELLSMKLNANIERVDILDFFPGEGTGNQFVSLTSGGLAKFYDFTWRKNFTGRILWGGGQLWPSFIYKEFEDYIQDKEPDLVICTHQVCANSAAKARLKMDKYFKIVSVPTDYETEGLWPHKQSDLFCVASEEMALTLMSRKVPEDKIVVSGLPVSSEFCKSLSKSQAKIQAKLPRNKKVALVIAGAKEPGPYKNIRQILNKSFKYFADMDWMHFVICVGQDAKYAKKLMYLAHKYEVDNITILTYTENLPLLMAASDIAVIKPGGLATTECICSKLPIILLGKTYAQENINRRYLMSCGIAEHATSYEGFISLLCDVFVEKDRYNKLVKNINKVRKTKSAQVIAKKSVAIMNKNFDVNKKRTSLYLGKRPVHTQ